MEIILSFVGLLIGLIAGYILGSGSGVKSALKSNASTYDQSMNYLKPINEFIEREFLLEIHRRARDGRGDVTNGRTAIVDLLTNSDKFVGLLTAVTTIVTTNMSKNLKNAFYRLYTKDDEDTTLMRYINQWCLLRSRELAVSASQILNVPAGKRDDAASVLALSLEAEVHNIMGINLNPTSNNK